MQPLLLSHPGIVSHPALSTAQAASQVAQMGNKTVGCIASSLAAQIYGLEVLSENIQNSSGNSTRFVVVEKAENDGRLRQDEHRIQA